MHADAATRVRSSSLGCNFVAAKLAVAEWPRWKERNEDKLTERTEKERGFAVMVPQGRRSMREREEREREP